MTRDNRFALSTTQKLFCL